MFYHVYIYDYNKDSSLFYFNFTNVYRMNFRGIIPTISTNIDKYATGLCPISVTPFTMYGVAKLPNWLIPSIIPAPEDAIFYGNDSVCNNGINP